MNLLIIVGTIWVFEAYLCLTYPDWDVWLINICELAVLIFFFHFYSRIKRGTGSGGGIMDQRNMVIDNGYNRGNNNNSSNSSVKSYSSKYSGSESKTQDTGQSATASDVDDYQASTRPSSKEPQPPPRWDNVFIPSQLFSKSLIPPLLLMFFSQ